MTKLPSASCAGKLWAGFAAAEVTGRDPGANGEWGRLRAGTLGPPGTGGMAAGASLGCPGQERVQAGCGRGGAAVFGAGLQVAGQQAEGLDAVPGGGGGDGPHIGGQVSGPFRPG